MKRLIITEDVFQRFPDAQVAVIVAGQMNNRVVGTAALLEQEVSHAKSIFSESSLSANEHIESWRKAYKNFGAEKYRSSVEALLRRVIKNKPISSINPLVDIYNSISLKHVMPIGGEDLRFIIGDIRLTLATGQEHFIALGSDTNDPPEPGEVIYVDARNEVLCRRWNWREAEKTKLTPETTDAVLVIDALSPVNSIEIKEAANDLAQKVEKWCQAKTSMYLLNKNYSQIFL